MTLTRYLSRLFVVRILAVLVAMSALIELVEMLDAMRRLLGPEAHFANVLTFSLLRLPLAMEQLFLLAILVGAVLAFRSLAMNSEMAILRSAGLSPYRLLRSLLPLALVLAALNYVMVDRIAPAAERAFAQWWATVSPDGDDDEDDGKQRTLWLRAGGDIVSVASISDDGRRLGAVVIYRRAASGQLTQRIAADSAAYASGRWTLAGVTITDLGEDGAAAEHQDALPWPEGPSPGNLKDVAHPTERISSSKSAEILEGDRSGVAPTAHYRTIIHKSWRAPLLPLLMILLAMPAAAGGRRIGGMAKSMTLSLLTGLAYLILDGFLSSMSESGAMPPALAIWAAPAIFAALGGAILLYAEE
jgi:lipopolysaccharide export system permease protein